jgi:hypothetical protein
MLIGHPVREQIEQQRVIGQRLGNLSRTLKTMERLSLTPSTS